MTTPKTWLRMSGRVRVFAVLLLGGGLALWGVATAQPSTASDAGRPPEASRDDPRSPGTLAMVRRLAEMQQTPVMRQAPYNNSERLATFEARSRRRPDEPKLEFSIAQEQLCSGRTAEAIETLEWLEQQPRLKEETRDEIEFRLAISWLRFGEEQNCVARHGPDSCLLPIRGGGVHVDQAGSREAIRRLLERLERKPDDLFSAWLLNIANMTVGDYPEGVPGAWRIPAEAFASDEDIGRFPDVAARLGLAVDDHAGGCSVDDFDDDGDLDVLASGMGFSDPLRYFENRADGSFVERTQQAGLEGLTGGLNLTVGDYDNDGHLDVFVLRGGWHPGESGSQPNSLLRNLGQGRFSDVTEEAGVLAFHPTQTASFGDYDNDGFLDLFVGNESTKNFPHPCELYHNNGDGTFTDVAPRLGLDLVAFVKGVVFGDYDNDGLLDLFVSRFDHEPDVLYHNEGRQADGGWAFRDVAAEAGVTGHSQSFPAWWFDYDNDGWLDLFVSAFDGTVPDVFADAVRDPADGSPRSQRGRPSLYHNQGDGTFVDVAARVGLDDVLMTMGCNFGDLDNDGFLDMYLGTGNPDFGTLVPNRMFRNDGGQRFLDITTSGGFGSLQKGHGVAFSDIDNDGDNDVYAVIGGAYEADDFRNALFLNPGHGRHQLTLQLVGTTSNRDALGARLKVVTRGEGGSRQIHATVSTGGSFGCSSRRLTLGLGDAASIERLEIRWPSGSVETLVGLERDTAYRIREGEGKAVVHTLPRITF